MQSSLRAGPVLPPRTDIAVFGGGDAWTVEGTPPHLPYDCWLEKSFPTVGHHRPPRATARGSSDNPVAAKVELGKVWVEFYLSFGTVPTPNHGYSLVVIGLSLSSFMTTVSFAFCSI